MLLAFTVGHARPKISTFGWKPVPPTHRVVVAALIDFGAPMMGLTAKDLEVPNMGLQFGVPPLRVDILTKISGVEFADAWPGAIEANFADDVSVPVIGLEALLANKRAAGRPQDLADVDALRRLHEAKSRK